MNKADSSTTTPTGGSGRRQQVNGSSSGNNSSVHVHAHAHNTHGRRHHHSHYHNQYLQYSQGANSGGVGVVTSSSKHPVQKLTHRHLASLDFLLHIPMIAEAKIKENGILAMIRSEQLQQGELNGHGLHNNNEKLEIGGGAGSLGQLQIDDIVPDAPGKKLPGMKAFTVKVPTLLKYSIQKMTEKGAPYIQWNDQLLLKDGKTITGENTNVLSSRMFFSRTKSYPLCIFSVIKYDAEKEKQRRQKADDAPFEVFDIYKQGYSRTAGKDDWRGANFKQHLEPTRHDIQDIQDGDALEFFEQGYMHDPVALDDPDLIYGDDRYVMAQQADFEGPLVISVIKYVNKDVLKLKLNEKFRDSHSTIPASLTLSKIRSLKRKAVLLALTLSIELSTLAVATICFERLCLKSLVSKENRKLAMAVCILLAFKFSDSLAFNQQKEGAENENTYKENRDALFDYFDKKWEITKRQILDAEFGVYFHLGFSLHLPRVHVDWVFNQLLRLVKKNGSTYLIDNDYDMNELYMNDVKSLERTRIEMLEEQEKLNRENEIKEAEEGSNDLNIDVPSQRSDFDSEVQTPTDNNNHTDAKIEPNSEPDNGSDNNHNNDNSNGSTFKEKSRNGKEGRFSMTKFFSTKIFTNKDKEDSKEAKDVKDSTASSTSITASNSQETLAVLSSSNATVPSSNVSSSLVADSALDPNSNIAHDGSSDNICSSDGNSSSSNNNNNNNNNNNDDSNKNISSSSNNSSSDSNSNSNIGTS